MLDKSQIEKLVSLKLELNSKVFATANELSPRDVADAVGALIDALVGPYVGSGG